MDLEVRKQKSFFKVAFGVKCSFPLEKLRFEKLEEQWVDLQAKEI